MYTKPAVLALLFANTSAKQTSATPIVQVVEGMLMGALDAEGFDDIEHCIQDAETIFNDSEIAISDFKKGDVKDVIAGVKEVGVIIQVVKSAMSDCSHIKADWEKLAKMAAIFESPTSFAYHVGRDLIVNHAQIYSEISSAISAYDVHDWYNFGINVGKAAAKTILGEDEKKQLRDAKKIEQIVAGVLKGAIDAEGFTDINTCVHDIENVYHEAQTAVQDFEQKTASGVIAGLQEVAQMVGDIKTGVKDCTATKADWDKLDRIIKTVKNPASFAYHVGKDIMINGKDIYAEINTAVADYQKEDWTDFGFQIGEAMALALVGKEKMDKEMTAQIMQGVTNAYGGHFNLEALLACIGEEDKAALVFDAAYQQFQAAAHEKDTQTKIGDVIGGLILAFAGVQQAKQGLPACEAIDPKAWNYKDFQKSEIIYKHPLEHIKVIEEDIVLNGVSIMEDLEKAVASYGAGKYAEFGQYLGNIMQHSTELKVYPHQEYVQERKPTQKLPKVAKREIAAFSQGFLQATNVGTFNFTALLECIYEADQAAEALDMGVRELIKGVEDKDINDIIPGVIGIVAFVQTLRQTIPLCETVDPHSMNWTTFDNIVSTVEDPVNHMKTIDQDIFMNGKKITEEISEGINAWRSGDYQTFGESLGTTLKDTCEPQLFLF